MALVPDPLDLQCVVTLAETLNFTEAARRLHMTQPGVTARINRVEKNHGYKLFDRSKGIVRAITPEGFIFVEEAKRVLEDLQQLVTRSDAAHRAFSETLSISRSHHADLKLLSVVVAAQTIESMHISILPPCNSDEESIAMLLNGQADVSLVAWPVSDSRVAAIHLTHDSVLAVLPAAHALRGHVTIHLADLQNEQIIGSPQRRIPPIAAHNPRAVRVFDRIAALAKKEAHFEARDIAHRVTSDFGIWWW